MALKLKELSDCYQLLQSRLQNYATLKSKLDNKGEEVRREISKQVSDESQLLKAREKQLLGQVDVAAAHFMSVYLAHHAHLHQLVGVAQNFLSKHAADEEVPENNKNLETEARDICERIRSGLKFCDLDVAADVEEPLSVNFNHMAIAELERGIMDFGQVGNGKIFHLRVPGGDEENKTGFGFLPYGHEDYLDSDIEVLQSKPLLGTPSVIRFPKRIVGMPKRQVGLTPEERQRWLYNPTADKNALNMNMKPANDGVCWLKKDDDGKKRSSSSISESIEVLGNTDDDDDANWTEDDEFLLLKTFCKMSPICDQIGDCCGGDKRGNCVKRALEKPISSVSAASTVNIHYNNRSVSSRTVTWLMRDGNNKNAEVGEVINEGLAEWRKIISKQWEKTWKADNETWLIRKKRIMDQNAEKEDAQKTDVAPIAPTLPKKPLFERLEMKNKTWVIMGESGEVPSTPSPATERIFAKPSAMNREEMSKWRLVSTPDDKIDCSSIFAEMRAKKADTCDWVSANDTKTLGKESSLNESGLSGINYKAWLAPERNCSPHSEKFLSGTGNKEKLFMMKNLFTTGRTIKSDASWLAPKEGTA